MMKNYTKGIFAMLFLFGFYGCANGKKTQEEPPIAVDVPYYITWTGGLEGAGSGLNLFIPVKEKANMEIELDSVYFRGKRAKLQTKPGSPNLYIAYFTSSKASEKTPDLVMSSDPKKEYGNKPPIIIGDFPFNLKKDEAMVGFKKDGKIEYFKISGIKEREEEVKMKNPKNIRH